MNITISGGLIKTAKPPQSKDEALEALDFIVNVLKEHEKDLDKIVSELSNVAEQMGNTGEITNKMEKLEQKINVLQREVTNIIGYVSSSAAKTASQPQAATNLSAAVLAGNHGPSVVLHCEQWADFHSLAVGAQAVSFRYKLEEKNLHVDAIKGNQIISYCGAAPKFSFVMRAFLSKELNVLEKNVLEGALTVR